MIILYKIAERVNLISDCAYAHANLELHCRHISKDPIFACHFTNKGPITAINAFQHLFDKMTSTRKQNQTKIRQGY